MKRFPSLPQAAIIVLLLTIGCSRTPESTPIPAPDLTALDAAARTRVEERLAAVRTSPDEAESWGRAAMICHAYNLLDAADSLYAEARELDPRSQRWAYLHGLCLREQERKDDAREAFRQAMDLSSGEPYAALRYANALLETGVPREAAEVYRDLVRRFPTLMAARYGLGLTLFTLGEYDDAVEPLRRAASLSSGYQPLFFALSQAHQAIGDQNAAMRFLETYQALPPPLQPPFPDPFERELRVLDQGSYLAHLDQGMELEEQGRLADAAEQYRQATAVDPERPEAWTYLISAYGGQRLFNQAEDAYRKATSISAALEEAHYNYGVLAAMQGDDARAAKAYLAALGVNPYSARANLNLGGVRERQGNWEQAARRYEGVLEYQPDAALAHFRLGANLLQRGDAAEGLDHLRRAASVDDPQRPMFLAALARACRDAGLEDEALQHAAEAQALAQRAGISDLSQALEQEFPAIANP